MKKIIEELKAQRDKLVEEKLASLHYYSKTRLQSQEVRTRTRSMLIEIAFEQSISSLELSIKQLEILDRELY